VNFIGQGEKMTYCVGMKLEGGLILASDTRSNAGVDHISTYCKMHTFHRDGERKIFLLSAGNLATTQETISLLRQSVDRENSGHLLSLASLFECASVVGTHLRSVLEKYNHSKAGVDFSATFILAGQIKGEEPRLFLIYPEGNFIEATPETPFFQIGEAKYGKPIIDRVLEYNTPLKQALKCALISFDSTLRSNISVGMPLDVTCLEKDLCLSHDQIIRIHENDPYMKLLRFQWGEGLRSLFETIPDWDVDFQFNPRES
jgi:putative proteasome-type protease